MKKQTVIYQRDTATGDFNSAGNFSEMKTYITTDDGQVYSAKDALDFVKQLKESSRTAQGLTLNQFMRETAQRAADGTGFKIANRNAEQFLASLLHAGLVKESAEPQ